MHQSKKGQQEYVGIQAQIGVDVDSGLVHTVRCKSGSVSYVVEANSPLCGEETGAVGVADY